MWRLFLCVRPGPSDKKRPHPHAGGRAFLMSVSSDAQTPAHPFYHMIGGQKRKCAIQRTGGVSARQCQTRRAEWVWTIHICSVRGRHGALRHLLPIPTADSLNRYCTRALLRWAVGQKTSIGINRLILRKKSVITPPDCIGGTRRMPRSPSKCAACHRRPHHARRARPPPKRPAPAKDAYPRGCTALAPAQTKAKQREARAAPWSKPDCGAGL